MDGILKQTLKVTRVVRKVTRTGYPMWMMIAEGGDRVFAFSHQDKEKDTARLLIEAGYPVDEMAENQEVSWKTCPITIRVIKDGDFWKLTAVKQRGEGDQPDPEFMAQAAPAIRSAIRWAGLMLEEYWQRTVFLDTETTGVDQDAEIVSIGVIDTNGYVLCNQLIRPANIAKLTAVNAEGKSAADIHGIRPEDLADQPTFAEFWPGLARHLNAGHVIIYNAKYDVGMLERECERAGKEYFTWLGVHCAMEWWARYWAEWNPAVSRWASKKLTEAAAACGIEEDGAHDAVTDCKMTLGIVKAMAAGQKIRRD